MVFNAKELHFLKKKDLTWALTSKHYNTEDEVQVKLTTSRNRFSFLIQSEFYLRLCVYFSIFHNL